MPGSRRNDEEPPEETTVLTRRGRERPTAPAFPDLDSESRRSVGYEEATVLVKRGKHGPGARQGDDPKTRIVGSPTRRPAGAGPGTVGSVHPDAMDDPVAGWLVVIHGPGKGNALPLGLGTNTIGRSRDSRVRIDFGDDLISRSAHARVTYDPRGRSWFVHHGDGKNLTYLNDKPVLEPTPLEPHMQIVIGATRLRFVPFCTSEFDWQDVADDS